MKGRIPDRWEEYQPVGKVVEGTRFIAFKVPLNSVLSRSLPDGIERFLPENLPAAIREQDRELGLVIDLTNTTRYYSEKDILKQGIEYKKIFTEGHSVPSRDVQNHFFKAVDDFLSSNRNNDRVIGVHCTHGLNRTGYLVCRYMIDRMKFKADDAIRAFDEARGHAMERQNYLSDLRAKPVLDVPSSNKDCKWERKRVASADECFEDSAASTHTARKQRCLVQTPRTGAVDDHLQPSSTNQSGAYNHWSQGHNGSRSKQDSQGCYGSSNHQTSNYRSYRQHGYDQHNYDFARQSHGCHRQSYSADQKGYRSDGCWKPHSYDERYYAGQHNFASNDFSAFTGSSDFSDPSFRPPGGRPHGRQFRGRSQGNSRLEYGCSGQNYGLGKRTKYSDDHNHPRESKQWRGNDHS